METVAAAGMALLGTAYFLMKKKYKAQALVCKALATCIPACLLVLRLEELKQGNVSAPVFLSTLAAIGFYMAADVLLECRFVAGAVCFGAGHLCITAGILAQVSGSGTVKETGLFRDFFMCAAVMFVLFMFAAYLALRRYLTHLKKLFAPAVVYIILLTVMASCAVAWGFREGGAGGAASLAGGISFVVSDILLGINRLGRKRSTVRGALVLLLYYLSVYLLVKRLWC